MTDHRAEAIGYLNTATETRDAQSDAFSYVDEAIVSALIGIGHALLAAFPDDDDGYEGLPPGDTISLPSSAHTIGAGMHIPKPTDQQTYR
jgi:hypothetical protein